MKSYYLEVKQLTYKDNKLNAVDMSYLDFDSERLSTDYANLKFYEKEYVLKVMETIKGFVEREDLYGLSEMGINKEYFKLELIQLVDDKYVIKEEFINKEFVKTEPIKEETINE